MKVCIDPGHGGVDPGAIGENPFRLEEKDFNLSLALLLEEELEGRGHWVVMGPAASSSWKSHFQHRGGNCPL